MHANPGWCTPVGLVTEISKSRKRPWSKSAVSSMIYACWFAAQKELAMQIGILFDFVRLLRYLPIYLLINRLRTAKMLATAVSGHVLNWRSVIHKPFDIRGPYIGPTVEYTVLGLGQSRLAMQLPLTKFFNFNKYPSSSFWGRYMVTIYLPPPARSYRYVSGSNFVSTQNLCHLSLLTPYNCFHTY